MKKIRGQRNRNYLSRKPPLPVVDPNRFYRSGENNIGSSSGKAPLGNYGGKAYARLGKFIVCTMGLPVMFSCT